MENSIGFCQWIESGDTIETAIPDVYNAIGHEKEWRAIILLSGEDSSVASHPASPDNPYDYDENSADEYYVKESDIPLIRLTQMLGGVPSPQSHFKSEVVNEEGKLSRMIYRPIIDEDEEDRYNELTKKYFFAGVPPVEIILVTVKQKQSERTETLKKVWKKSKSDIVVDFWKRNGYPSLCRFTYFEVDNRSSLQTSASKFEIWTTVMLLATNEINSSTLQAYMLYSLKVDFNETEMRDTLVRTAGRAIGAKQYLKLSIQRELDQRVKQDRTLPSYRLNAPVVIKMPSRKELYASVKKFPFFCRSVTTDLEYWETSRVKSYNGIQKAILVAERGLDHTADSIRDFCFYKDNEVAPLDNYQTEDFNMELDAIYAEMLNLRKKLPEIDLESKKKMSTLSREVRDDIVRRTTLRQTVRTYLIVLGALLLTALPTVVFKAKNGVGAWRWIILAVVVFIVSATAVIAFLLYLQKKRLNDKIQSFNGFASRLVNRISENTIEYSQYMGTIASHIHGRSYMSHVSRKKYLRDESQFHMQSHISFLDALLENLENWGNAFHLGANFAHAEVDENLTIDISLPPYINPLYTFESDDIHDIPVNYSGDCVKSPFSFISRLNIIREELYDDTD